MLSGQISQFAKLSEFKTKGEFNRTISNFLAENSENYTKGELEAFNLLVRYSIKYKGVSNARVGVFTKTSHEEKGGHGFSRSTFERMQRKSVKLGILTVHSTVKVNKGGYSHNVYVFNRYEAQEKAQASAERDPARTASEGKEQRQGQPEKRSGVSKLEKIKMLAIAMKRGNDEPFKRKLKYSKTEKLTERKQPEKPAVARTEQPKTGTKAFIPKALFFKDIKKRVETLDHTFTGDFVPEEFKDLVKCFYDDAKTIEEYWKMVKVASYDYRHTLDEETILHTAMHSFRQLIGKVKKSAVRNPVAYFTGILKKQVYSVFMDAIQPELHEDSTKPNVAPHWSAGWLYS